MTIPSTPKARTRVPVVARRLVTHEVRALYSLGPGW